MYTLDYNYVVPMTTPNIESRHPPGAFQKIKKKKIDETLVSIFALSELKILLFIMTLK